MREMKEVSPTALQKVVVRAPQTLLAHRDESLAAINADAAKERSYGRQLCRDFYASPGVLKINTLSITDFIVSLGKEGLKNVLLASIKKTIQLSTDLEKFAEHIDNILKNIDLTDTQEEKNRAVADLLKDRGSIEALYPNLEHYDLARVDILKAFATHVYPDCDTRGIELMAKFQDQVSMGLGIIFMDDFFKKATAILELGDNPFPIDRNEDREVTLLFSSHNEWHYQVTAKISLTDPMDKSNRHIITHTAYDFKMTETGFELVSLKYDNPLIGPSIERSTDTGATPQDQFNLLRDITQNLEPTTRNRLLNAFSEDQNIGEFNTGTTLSTGEFLSLTCSIQEFYTTFLDTLLQSTSWLEKQTLQSFLDDTKPSDAGTQFWPLLDSVRDNSASSAIIDAFHSARLKSYISTHPETEPADLVKTIFISKTPKFTSYPVKDAADQLVFTLHTTPEKLQKALNEVELSRKSPSPMRFFERKQTELETALSSSVGSPLRTDLNKACYEVRKSQIKELLPYIKSDDEKMRLVSELLTIQEKLKITDPALPRVSNLAEQYDHIDWGTNPTIIRLDTMDILPEQKMLLAYAEALRSPASPTALALTSSFSKGSSSSEDLSRSFDRR